MYLDVVGLDIEVKDGGAGEEERKGWEEVIRAESLRGVEYGLRCGFLDEVTPDDYVRGVVMYVVGEVCENAIGGDRRLYEYCERELRKNGFDEEYWNRYGKESGEDREYIEGIMKEDDGGWRNVRRVEKWCEENCGDNQHWIDFR
ncbi:hypothetical protein TrVE_jg717 [Triparma verrucosa]|nr:hypothetical protein TrVE_jg717 [Triparma verrucosa]